MKFYEYVCKLGNVKRFAAIKLDQEYNGAEHSFRVAMMAMLFTDEYNLNPKNKTKINVEEVLRKAIIHDLEESKTGDIPTPVKQFPGVREIIRAASEHIMEKEILVGLPESIKALYLKLWKEDKDNASGEVIAVADKLEALSKSAYELNRGNRDLEEPFMNIHEWFSKPANIESLHKFPSAVTLYKEAMAYPEVKVLVKQNRNLKVVG